MINFVAENVTSGECPISDQIERSAAREIYDDSCEFFYSHWWNCTPFKKTQKLVRPPYMPIAPNNSTQYIIDNHFEIEFDKTGRDEVEESIVTVNNGDCDSEKYEHKDGVQHFDVGLDLSKDHQGMKSAAVGATGHLISGRCQQQNGSVKDNLQEGYVKRSHLLEIDYDYESLYDGDFFEFVQNDFLQTYQELQGEKLLSLPKSELIVKILELETRFDELQRKEEMQNLT